MSYNECSVEVDPEHIPETLGVKWDYNPDGTSVHHRVPCKYAHSHLGTILYSQNTYWHVSWKWKETWKSGVNPHAYKLSTLELRVGKSNRCTYLK